MIVIPTAINLEYSFIFSPHPYITSDTITWITFNFSSGCLIDIDLCSEAIWNSNTKLDLKIFRTQFFGMKSCIPSST